ncbi:iron-sulfur cluster assembly scaffold protein [Pacificispira sp.]|uniref:iron-sulfur cluster assembly scaffold protein n=1 Tax=Pacificispira sp. TaxID=2888761 RepID=UPI003BA8E04B
MESHEALYNDRILTLAGGLAKDDRLADPDASVQMDSPLCGSRIRVDVKLAPDGRIAAYGQQVRACALGQSAAAIMKAHAAGKSVADLEAIRDAVEAMLKRGGPAPSGEWADLAVLEPARNHKSRHASILLPFKAVVRAMEDAAAGRATGTDG